MFTIQDCYNRWACDALEHPDKTAEKFYVLNNSGVFARCDKLAGEPQPRTRNPVQSAWDSFTVRQKHAARFASVN